MTSIRLFFVDGKSRGLLTAEYRSLRPECADSGLWALWGALGSDRYGGL